VVMFALF